MRKLMVEAEVSPDGVVNKPDMMQEIFRYHGDDVKDYLGELRKDP